MTAPTNPGDVIAGKYRVERVLGAGGMGVVVEATHLTLEEKVAIKFLKPEALENIASVARFAREARAAAKIKSEHVCRVLDVVVDGGMPYLVMECLEGRDLDDLVEKTGPVALDEAVDYVLQACEALAEAHLAGIIHRDLKPANLFLARRADGSPVVKVLDFGISKVQPKPGSNDAAMTATSSLLGSPLYMSPEQMKATRDVDVRTDIWSVGVILYEILTGGRPFNGETIPQICASILSEPPVPIAGRVPPEIERIIFKCLEKRPEDRYQTIAELAEALRPIAPSHAQLSIDRVSRVLGGPRSSAQSLPRSVAQPSAATAPVAPQPAPVTAALPAPAPAQGSGAFAASGEAPARSGGVGLGTNATFEAKVDKRRGGAKLGLLALAAALVLAAAAFLVLSSGRVPPAQKGVAGPGIASGGASASASAAAGVGLAAGASAVAGAVADAPVASPAVHPDAGAGVADVPSSSASAAAVVRPAPRPPRVVTPSKPAASSPAKPNFGGRD